LDDGQAAREGARNGEGTSTAWAWKRPGRYTVAWITVHATVYREEIAFVELFFRSVAGIGRAAAMVQSQPLT
jgi:hypothetical protein